MNIHERIRYIRQKRNLTLAEVADLLGVKEATVSRYETGEIKNIKHDTVLELANIFDVSPSYLMGWEEEHKEPTVVAAHSDRNLTPEEQEKVMEYIKFLQSQRNNK